MGKERLHLLRPASTGQGRRANARLEGHRRLYELLRELGTGREEVRRVWNGGAGGAGGQRVRNAQADVWPCRLRGNAPESGTGCREVDPGEGWVDEAAVD